MSSILDFSNEDLHGGINTKIRFAGNIYFLESMRTMLYQRCMQRALCSTHKIFHTAVSHRQFDTFETSLVRHARNKFSRPNYPVIIYIITMATDGPLLCVRRMKFAERILPGPRLILYDSYRVGEVQLRMAFRFN